jgi:hypothetical protein
MPRGPCEQRRARIRVGECKRTMRTRDRARVWVRAHLRVRVAHWCVRSNTPAGEYGSAGCVRACVIVCARFCGIMRADFEALRQVLLVYWNVVIRTESREAKWTWNYSPTEPPNPTVQDHNTHSKECCTSLNMLLLHHCLSKSVKQRQLDRFQAQQLD